MEYIYQLINIGSLSILPVQKGELILDIERNPIDIIGLFAPFILFGISAWVLRTQPPYLGGYVFFAILNSLFNQVLKSWIKEERPNKNGVAIRHHHYPSDSFGFHDNYVSFSSLKPVTKNGKELDYPKGGRGFEGSETALRSQPGSHEVALREPRVPPSYGMPSAHTQSSFFSIGFLYWVTKSVKWLLIGCFIGALTVYQRWKYKMHSIEQLVVGAIVGLGFSILGYQMTYRHIHK